MDKEVTVQETDLNKEIADAYQQWARRYLLHMPQGKNEDHDDYIFRICALAFCEGVRAIQSIIKTALIEVLSDRQS